MKVLVETYKDLRNDEEDNLYNIIAVLSVLIRQFLIPNPFDMMENGLIINWIMEPIMYVFTFAIVGLFYERGSEPTVGSFLYLFFYCIHTGLLFIMSWFGFAKMPIIIICIIYAVIIVVIKVIKDTRTL